MTTKAETIEMRKAKSIREYMDFLRKNAATAAPYDSAKLMCRGIIAEICGKKVVMYLPLSIISRDADTIGEKTRQLLTSPTAKALRELADSED